MNTTWLCIFFKSNACTCLTNPVLLTNCILLFCSTEVLRDKQRPFVCIEPDASLFEAIRTLIQSHVHRLPVVDKMTGNAIYILTHKRILRFMYLYVSIILVFEAEKKWFSIICYIDILGPVVQSIVSLRKSLRCQLVKYMPTTLSNPLLFFVEKMWESFEVQKILTFFQQKITVDLLYLRF